MSNVNKIILVGTVTEKPETRFGMENNSSIAKFTLSVDRPARMDGTTETDFIPVVTFGNNADLVAEKINQGSLVLVDGRIQVKTLEKDGQREWVTEVLATAIKPLTTNPASAAPQATTTEQPTAATTGNPFIDNNNTTEDDVPF